MEMLHQDLRPDNIMIDKTGTAKIIDFGSTQDRRRRRSRAAAPATTTSSEPRSTPRRNISWAKAARRAPIMFSLGVIAYQMLTGQLPYGAQIAKAQNRSRSNASSDTAPRSTTIARFPAWIDGALRRAVHPDP